MIVLIAEVFKLEWLTEIAATHQRHHGLQVITGFSGHADLFTLDLRLHFELTVFDKLNDFFLYRALNPLLQLRFHKPGFAAVNKIFRYI